MHDVLTSLERDAPEALKPKISVARDMFNKGLEDTIAPEVRRVGGLFSYRSEMATIRFTELAGTLREIGSKLPDGIGRAAVQASEDAVTLREEVLDRIRKEAETPDIRAKVGRL